MQNNTITSKSPKVTAKEGEVVITLLAKPQLPQSFGSYRDNKLGKDIFYEQDGDRARITISGTRVLRKENPNDEALIRFMLGGKNIKGQQECGFVNSNAWNYFKDAIQIEDRVTSATIKNTIRAEKGRAEKAVVEAIDGGKLVEMGYLFGIFSNFQSNTMHDEVLKGEIYNIVDNTPSTVLKVLNNPDREMWLVLKKGLFFKTFRIDNSIFYYGQSPMGITEDICIEWFKTNQDVYGTLKSEIDKLK